MPTNYSGRITLIFTVFDRGAAGDFLGAAVALGQPASVVDPEDRSSSGHRHGRRREPGLRDSSSGQLRPRSVRARDGCAEKAQWTRSGCGTWSGARRAPTASRSRCRCRPKPPRRPGSSKAYNDAVLLLDATQITKDAVLNAVEHSKGGQRQQSLAQLASDSKTRAELFKNLCDTYDKIQAPSRQSGQAVAARPGRQAPAAHRRLRPTQGPDRANQSHVLGFGGRS